MKRRLLSILTAVVMTLAMMPALPQTDTADAASGTPLFRMGASGLDGYTNTGDSSLKICLDGYEWYPIGYDGRGNSLAAKKDAITLFYPEMSVSSHAFNESADDGNGYKGSSLESTINSLWVEQFSAPEKAAVMPRTLVGGSANCGEEGYDSNKIKGETVQNAYVWPLSVAEAAELPDKLKKADSNVEVLFWWTRSPGSDDNLAQVINKNGQSASYYDSDYGRDIVGFGVGNQCRVYTATDLRISSVLFSHDRFRGKPTAVGADSLSANESGINVARVLTLKDPARSGFDASAVSLSESGTLEIKYSNAVAGSNNYISAMVTDSQDNILYYGKLADASSAANSTVDVETAGKWTPEGTNKLYIFNEEVNHGLARSDYSSPLIEIDGSMFISESLPGSGTEEDPYEIKGSEGWNLLAELVSEGESTSGTYYKLDKDIRVSTMVGTSDHPFNGIFDGNEKTITFNSTATGQYCAPFSYVGTASFKDLRVEGTITTSEHDSSGLIGRLLGDCEITDCVSNINITVTNDKDNHTGFVSRVASGAHVGIEGSSFTGTIDGPDSSYCAGFVGNEETGSIRSTITNCLYAGEMNTKDNSSTFVRTSNAATNSYYLEPIGQGRDKGKRARSVSAESGVTIGFGSGTTYEVSEITAYSKGLGYRGTFYAGADDEISITLPQLKEGMSYKANTGTLSGSGTAYTLKLADSDVTISRIYSKLAQPNNVRVIADASENGLLSKNGFIKGRWSAIEGADGYKVTIFDAASGRDHFSELDVTGIRPEDGMITYDFSGRIGDRSGKFAIKVTAYTNSGVTSNTAVSSDSVEFYNLNADVGKYQLTIRALKGSNIGACITEAFTEGFNDYMYIGSDGKYYCGDSEGDVQVLMFLPYGPQYYDTLAEARADALFEPGKSTGKSVTGNVEMETLLNTDLCTNGAMHHYVVRTLQRKAGIGEGNSGSADFVCSVCGREITKDIMAVTTIGLSKASFAYTGKQVKPAVTVKDSKGKSLVKGRDYTVSYSSNTKVGTAKATVKLINNYSGEKTLSFKIVKAANPMKIKAKKAVVKYSKLRQKTQTLKTSKIMKFTVKAQGKVTYKLAKVTRKGKKGTKSSKAKKYFRVAAKTGKVKVKKGLKKGQYIVSVKVKAAGNAGYKASAWKTVKCKVIVK